VVTSGEFTESIHERGGLKVPIKIIDNAIKKSSLYREDF
jgi:hypothetical protein